MKKESAEIIIGGFSEAAVEVLVAAIRAAGREGRHVRRRRFDADVVERCQEIWEMARTRQVVRMGAKRKVSHADVFAYARGKLCEMGIKTVDDFEAALGAYSDRQARERGWKRIRR